MSMSVTCKGFLFVVRGTVHVFDLLAARCMIVSRNRNHPNAYLINYALNSGWNKNKLVQQKKHNFFN